MIKGKISCVIASYNTPERYLLEAVDSILAQTYSNFELIIVDDGSDIPVTEILSNVDDDRVHVITNSSNEGVTKSRNRALNYLTGEYMAVMDSDDISAPTRFEKQVAYLKSHSQVDLVSAQMQFLTNDTRLNPWIRIPDNSDRYLSWLFWDNSRPFPHGPAMIRVEFLKKHHIMYNENYRKALDYRLWVDCARHKGKFHILDEYLYYYRVHDAQISQSGREGQMYYADRICLDQLKYLHITPTAEEEKLHLLLRDSDSYEDGRGMLEWKEKLKCANNKYKYCEPKVFEREIDYRFFKMCYKEFIVKQNKVYYKYFMNSCTIYNIFRSIINKLRYKLRKHPGFLKV